jgi:hypothetical protein
VSGSTGRSSPARYAVLWLPTGSREHGQPGAQVHFLAQRGAGLFDGHERRAVEGRGVAHVPLQVCRPLLLAAQDELGDTPLLGEDQVGHGCRAADVSLDLGLDGGCFRFRLGLLVGEGATEGLLVALLREGELVAQAGGLSAVGRLLLAGPVESLHRLAKRLPVLAGARGRLAQRLVDQSLQLGR